MPRALILYHFFHPDDVVSSRHFSDLAVGLAERGWEVKAKPCNRACRDDRKTYVGVEYVENVVIERVWRPGFVQSGSIGRIMNALWMLIAWSLSALHERPDVLIVGTDPILSVLVAIPWKLVRPRTKIVHWCFDLYPEAAIADGAVRLQSRSVKALQTVLRAAYHRCDVLADIGPCMRRLLEAYAPGAEPVTITPWALAEPMAALAVDVEERRSVFGQVPLALMYSGNFGRAHSYHELLDLARALGKQPVRFAFSIRGNRADELRSAVSPADTNVAFVPFAEEERLENRLSAADIHVVSLRHEWTGTVVPSKFFGALAVGRPVLFVGSRHCSVAHWIDQHQVGWVLDGSNRTEIAAKLSDLANEPEKLNSLFAHCHSVYRKHFSRPEMIGRFDRELRSITTDLRLSADPRLAA